jgi:hypothetical protein
VVSCVLTGACLGTMSSVSYELLVSSASPLASPLSSRLLSRSMTLCELYVCWSCMSWKLLSICFSGDMMLIKAWREAGLLWGRVVAVALGLLLVLGVDR